MIKKATNWLNMSPENCQVTMQQAGRMFQLKNAKAFYV